MREGGFADHFRGGGSVIVAMGGGCYSDWVRGAGVVTVTREGLPFAFSVLGDRDADHLVCGGQSHTMKSF